MCLILPFKKTEMGTCIDGQCNLCKDETMLLRTIEKKL